MEAKKELINQLKDLTENPDVFQARRELKHLFDEFQKLKAIALETQRTTFHEAHELLSDEEKITHVFSEASDPLDDEFEKTYRTVRFNINEKAEKRKTEQQTTYKTKLDIIEQITALAHEENIAKAFKTFNDLKEAWKNAGLAGRSQEKDLHDKHNAVIKEFYYNMNIYKELKAYDFDKNLDARKKIIERCEEALKLESIQKKRDRFYQLQQNWYDAGPVSREDYESLQEIWKSINDKFHEQLGEYYEKLHTEQDDNLEKKQALVEKVKMIDTSLIDSHSKWQKKTKQVIEIQNNWKKIGFARRKDNEAIWRVFRAACDDFFKEKQVFYDQLKGEQEVNRAAKQALIDRAIELNKSTDWKKTTQDFIKLQKEWKTIPPAHHRDEKRLWIKFRESCNAFFDKKKNHFSAADEATKENLLAKTALLEELKAYKPEGEKTAIIEALQLFANRWNAVGHVPYREKDGLEKAWQKQMNALYSAIQLNEEEQINIVYKNRVDQLASSSNPEDAIYNEKAHIREKIDRLKSDLIQFENNMGFINSKDNKLLDRLQENADKTRHEIDQLVAKIKLLTIASHKLD